MYEGADSEDMPVRAESDVVKDWQLSRAQSYWASTLTLVDAPEKAGSTTDEAEEKDSGGEDDEHAAQKANLVEAVRLAVMLLSWVVKLADKEFDNLTDDVRLGRSLDHVNWAEWEDPRQHQSHVDHLEKKEISPASLVWMLHFMSSRLGTYRWGQVQCSFGSHGCEGAKTEEGIRQWAVDVLLVGTDTNAEHYQRGYEGQFECLLRVPGLSLDQRSASAQALVAISQTDVKETPTTRSPDLTVNGVHESPRPEECFASLLVLD